MATWQSAKNYLVSNYKCEPYGDDGLRLTFNLSEGRSQIIVAVPAGPVENPGFLDFHSPVGDFGAVDLEKLVRRTIDFSLGGVSTHGGVVTLRASLPLENLDINEIEDPLKLLTLVADQLEGELTGADDF